MMKKTKALSLTLAILMLLTLIPMFALPASATEIPAHPTALPDGSAVTQEKLWIDWSTVGVANANATIDTDGLYKVAKKDTTVWCKNDAYTTSWRGASGIMFYADASGISGNTDFIFEILAASPRQNSASGAGCVQLNTSPTKWRSAADGGPLQIGSDSSVAYYLEGNEWKEFKVSYPSYYLNCGKNMTGWIYLPFTSIWYQGGSASAYDWNNDTAKGLNFTEFMSRFEDQRLWKASVKSNTPGMKFGDLYFVYSAPEVENGATANLFGSMALNGNPEGEATGKVNGNAVTVSSMTGNSATASGNRVWLKGLAQTNLSGATGLRFHVDTTKLDDGARLQLRLRMRAGVSASAVNNVFASGTSVGNTSITSTSNGMPQYVCRSDNSVAYYFDADGEAHSLSINPNVSTTASVTSLGENDLFEALPKNYVGDIYIPLESFWMNCNSFAGTVNGGNNKFCSMSFSDASALYPIDLLTICHVIDGTTTSDEITYSNFELVYANTKIDSQSVTINDSFDINYYAALQEGASAPKMTFTMDGKKVEATGSKQENGLYKFTYSGILPQQIGDTLTAEYSATIGKATVKQTTTYSVKQYCENMLKTSADAKLKTLLVDILYYGDAAQKYANYKTDSLATAGLTDEQKALRSANTTADITATAKIAGTADGVHSWKGANLYLNSRLSMELTFRADSIEGLKIKVNGTEYTPEEKSTGVYKVRIDNISITSGDVTANFVKDGTDTGETLTYSIDAYIKKALATDASANATELLVSLYGYRTSALAYAGASN